MDRVIRSSYSANASSRPLTSDQSIPLGAFRFARTHVHALAIDQDVALTCVAQVVPPRRVAVFARVRGEHDVAVAVA